MKGASINRLACLSRHWTWADEAMARFERELANGWEYGEDPRANQLFSTSFHWCALLCGFSEAALEHGFCRRRNWTRSVQTSKRVCLSCGHAGNCLS